jgi:hypothetical protein
MLAAIVQIHLGLDVLVAAEDYGRFDLPHEEAVGTVVKPSGHILLCSEIETQPA